MSNMKLIMENWRATLKEGDEMLSFHGKEFHSEPNQYLRRFKGLDPQYEKPKDIANCFKLAMKHHKKSSESQEIINKIAQELESSIKKTTDEFRNDPDKYSKDVEKSYINDIHTQVKEHIEKTLKELGSDSEV